MFNNTSMVIITKPHKVLRINSYMFTVSQCRPQAFAWLPFGYIILWLQSLTTNNGIQSNRHCCNHYCCNHISLGRKVSHTQASTYSMSHKICLLFYCALLCDTVHPWYLVIFILQTTLKRRPIAHPSGWDMGCLWEFRVWPMFCLCYCDAIADIIVLCTVIYWESIV